ncbi:MAG: helix-hairpin-helix domain-containing protein [Thermoanaerobaculia bacterium]|nr:helix-hairpin-helix domain-containing protein [Thermoanaerobaculia bacterium]
MRAHRRRELALMGVLAVVLAALAAPAGGAEQAGRVNLNTATAEQLAYLPRVGPVVAQRIVEYREENGGFDSPEELMLVRGIGEKTFELIEPYVATDGETTLTEKVSVSRDDEGGS